MNGVPTRDQVRQWIGVPVSAVTDADLDQILAAELAIQARTCRLPDDSDPDNPATYPEALARAVMRRCQREVAARAVPLGAIGNEANEYGAMTLPRWDAEISRLEASYRITVIA